MSVGCTHGSLADPDAIEVALKFKEAYKPEIRVHHGDVFDFSAFRFGAKGTKDEAEQLAPDIEAGCNFIEAYEPTHVILGNHDDRVFQLSSHHNAILRYAASMARNEFLETCRKVGARVIDSYDINDEPLRFGDTNFIHGFGLGGENALRDMAEHFGKCVTAHFHRAEIVGGRHYQHPICCCTGTLANVGMMPYAKTRRATARWSHGLPYGEYSDTYCHIELTRCDQRQAKNWRTPL